MKTRQGYVQGYNAQAVVSEEQIIVAVGVTQEANDVQQLEPMLQCAPAPAPRASLRFVGVSRTHGFRSPVFV